MKKYTIEGVYKELDSDTLKNILDNKKDYRSEAIIAAEAELTLRNISYNKNENNEENRIEERIGDFSFIEKIYIENSVLKIICSGEFGIGTIGSPRGAAIRSTIENSIIKKGNEINSIIIDFQNVDYEWGDGIIWSVIPAVYNKQIPVTYYANLNNAKYIQSAIFAFGETERIKLRVKS